MPPQTNALANHVAISVSNVEAAVKWYKEVLGLHELFPIRTVYASGPQSRPTLKKVYGSEIEEMKLAILSTGNGVGVEIFQFINPPYQGPSQPIRFGPEIYARGGFFHVCFTVPDVVAAAENVVGMGGRICGEFTQPLGGIDVVYVQDPWGNTLEFMPLGWEQFWQAFLERNLNQAKSADTTAT